MAVGATATLHAGDLSVSYAPLASVDGVERLPYSLRILLENALRHGSDSDVQAVAEWDATAPPSRELGFRPSRVLLQDFTGVPSIVDIAAMRSAMHDLGGDPAVINPHIPAELVIDHSVQVDEFATRLAITANVDRDYERNGERYAFLRWGQGAFDNLKVVPPNTGIVHQVNLEYLARVVEERDGVAFPDTLVGTDSHTTMVNGLGVLGWGVGGIEAEAALLGEELSMLVPQVVGVRLDGRLREGATATDLVLTITELLRKTGVVGKFVEYFGAGLAGLALADRATIGNMSPEYGATCGFFPVDDLTLAYLRLTGRPEERIGLVEAYCKENLLWHDESVHAEYSQVVELDLATVEPSLAGPRRPQDRVALTDAKEAFLDSLASFGHGYGNGTIDKGVADTFPASDPTSFQEPGPHTMEPDPAQVATAERPHLQSATTELDGEEIELRDGSVVIAAITSCTNTSNPQVMLGAGLLAKKAVERGLERKPWVKSSLAPGSRVVTDYYDKAGLTPYLEQLGFHTVGYGCTTCIGNSGPLPEPISAAVEEGDLVVCSVLSGNRNFEARIHPEVKANYLASPPLVVAYALAGRMDLDLETEPIGQDADGGDVFLRDLWPTSEEIAEAVGAALDGSMYRKQYGDVFTGDERWQALPVPEGDLYAWDESSTYVQRPPFFDGMPREPEPVEDVVGARCLVSLGDSVTTDHISPAGAIKPESPAGQYLLEHGVERRFFNSYGARRGNHEVLVRGTFANVRLRNLLVPGSEGTWTVHVPSGEEMTIFDAARRYREEGVPLIVLAGKEYGSGSSRDWAAKGPNLLGVRRDRRELRAHPPLEPAHVRDRPAPVHGRREPRDARLHRPGGVLDHRARQWRGDRGDRHRRRQGVPRARPSGDAARARVPAPRRNPAVRPAALPRRGLERERQVANVVCADEHVSHRHVEPPPAGRDLGRDDQLAVRPDADLAEGHRAAAARQRHHPLAEAARQLVGRRTSFATMDGKADTPQLPRPDEVGEIARGRPLLQVPATDGGERHLDELVRPLRVVPVAAVRPPDLADVERRRRHTAKRAAEVRDTSTHGPRDMGVRAAAESLPPVAAERSLHTAHSRRVATRQRRLHESPVRLARGRGEAQQHDAVLVDIGDRVARPRMLQRRPARTFRRPRGPHRAPHGRLAVLGEPFTDAAQRLAVDLSASPVVRHDRDPWPVSHGTEGVGVATDRPLQHRTIPRDEADGRHTASGQSRSP